MEKDFWLARWELAQTGFHQDEIHPFLQRYGHQLPVGGEVFVPLCGKSQDMLWLREQGFSVLGVELSPIAVHDFFEENALTFQCGASARHSVYTAERMRLLCGDFFDLAAEDVSRVRAVYDRASLVALPREMRERYVQHLVSILPSGAQILLVAIDYPQEEMAGPPFAVSAMEVESLYRNVAQIRQLDCIDVLADNPRFAARGVTRMHEILFLLTLA